MTLWFALKSGATLAPTAAVHRFPVAQLRAMGVQPAAAGTANLLILNNKILRNRSNRHSCLARRCDWRGIVAMKVKNSMHKGAHWVSPETPVTTLAQMMREQDIGAIPIGENDRLIGMVTDRDIALRAVANGKDISRLTARSVMTPGIVWCRDSDDISQALQIMG